MLDPSTVAASTHRPLVLVRRMAPGAGDTAETTLPILSPRREGCPARAPGGPGGAGISCTDGRTLEAVGNLTGREFDIRDGGHTLARVSRAWFTMRDTYGVDVADGEDTAMLLAVAVCLDRIHHEEDEWHAG